MSDELDEDEELGTEEAGDDVSLRPNENADDKDLVDRLVPAKIREKYEIVSYRNAAVILSQARNGEFEDKRIKQIISVGITQKRGIMAQTPQGSENDPGRLQRVGFLYPLGTMP
jgi:hypothetical protein